MYRAYRVNRFPARGCLVLAVLVGLMGCASRRKVARQRVVMQEISWMAEADSARKHTETATQRAGSKVMQVEWTQTVYDTSAPPDPSTGLHPVKSHTRASGRVLHDETESQVQRTDSQAVQHRQGQRQQRAEGQQAQEYERKRPAWLLQGAALCLALAVLLAVYVCWRRRRPVG